MIFLYESFRSFDVWGRKLWRILRTWNCKKWVFQSVNNTVCAPNCEPSGHRISPLTLSWLLFYFSTTKSNGSKRSPLEKRPRHANVTCARPWLRERTSTLGFSFLLFFFVIGAKISLLSRIVCLRVSVNSGKCRSIRMSPLLFISIYDGFIGHLQIGVSSFTNFTSSNEYNITQYNTICNKLALKNRLSFFHF